MKNFKNEYDKQGYYLFKSFFSRDYCKKIKLASTTLSPKILIPYSNIPPGVLAILSIRHHLVMY